MSNTHKIVTVNVPNESIRHVLSSAFDSGGVRNWMQIGGEHGRKEARKDLPRSLTYKWSSYTWIPLSEFGSVCCIEVDETTAEETRHTLDLAAIRRGLKVLAEKYPHQFADMIKDSGDMHTGDLFVQCCLFGEEKYA